MKTIEQIINANRNQTSVTFSNLYVEPYEEFDCGNFYLNYDFDENGEISTYHIEMQGNMMYESDTFDCILEDKFYDKVREIKEYLIISTIDTLNFMMEEGIKKNEYIILREEEIVLNMYENNSLPKKIKKYMEMQLGKENIKKYLKMKNK